MFFLIFTLFLSLAYSTCVQQSSCATCVTEAASGGGSCLWCSAGADAHYCLDSADLFSCDTLHSSSCPACTGISIYWTSSTDTSGENVNVETFLAEDRTSHCTSRRTSNVFTDLVDTVDTQVLLVPELEASLPNLDGTSRTLIREFVEDHGGLYVACMDSGARGSSLIRTIFGYGTGDFVRNSGGDSSTATPNATLVDKYPSFAGLTSNLARENAVYTLATSSLPEGTDVVYGSGAYAHVTVTPFGKGAIVVLAHDYYESDRSDWADMIIAAVNIRLGTPSPTPAPTPFTPAPPTPNPTPYPTASPTPAPPTQAPTPAPPCSIRVSLLMDPAVVPTTGEGASLSNILTAGGPGYCVTEEGDSTDVAAWSVSDQTAVVVPEQEVAQWTPSEADAAVLREFVEVGGELVVCGDVAGRSGQLIRTIFDFTASLSGGPVTGESTADVLALERFQQFRDAQRTIPAAPASYGWHTDKLPPLAHSLYTAGDKSTVVIIQFGVGHIVLLAHDFFTSDPLYANLLRRALFLEPGTLQPTPAPVASATTQAPPTLSPTPVPAALDACGSSFEVSLDGAHCFVACEAESKAIGTASCTCGASPCIGCACPDTVEVTDRVVYSDDDDSNNGNIATDRGASTDDGLPVGTIVGIVIGVIVLIACIVGGVVMSKR